MIQKNEKPTYSIFHYTIIFQNSQVFKYKTLKYTSPRKYIVEKKKKYCGKYFISEHRSIDNKSHNKDGRKGLKSSIRGFCLSQNKPCVIHILKGLSRDYMGDSGDYIVKAADYNNPLVT